VKSRVLTAGRLLTLAGVLIGRSWGRFTAVVALLTISVLVFIAVQAISTASAGTLDSSVSSELGDAGEYLIRIDPSLGPAAVLREPVLAALAQTPRRSLQIIDSFGAADIDCGAQELQGTRELLLLRDAHERPAPLARPPESPAMCLAGLEIGSFVGAVPRRLERAFPEAVVIDQDLAPTAAGLDPLPEQRSYLLVTGQEVDLSASLRADLLSQLSGPAAWAGADALNAVSIERLDDGASVRQAASGVRLVYALIGWAILLMAGTAVAVAEMANIRDRNWIFGLARSAGATRGNIAALVAVDGVLVLAVASLVSAVVLVPLAPAVERFALETLGSPIRLVAPGLVPQLALAAAVMILLGAAVPAARAARLDPVDVLERR
jgi:hypothetical protein